MKSYPPKFKSFQRKIVQMGALQKLQNSIQTLVIFWPVYPIHTNSLFWVTFEELPFCNFPPPKTSICGKDSQIYLIFHLNILVFQTNGKTTIISPSPLTFLQWPIGRQEILLPINHKNYNFREEKNGQVIKMPLWNWQHSKWICWLPSEERKTSLMSVKNATLHEKRTTAQNFAEIG